MNKYDLQEFILWLIWMILTLIIIRSCIRYDIVGKIITPTYNQIEKEK